DLVAEHRAGLDLPRARTGLAVLVRRDHEHVVAARSLAQRAHGDGNGRARRAHGNADGHRGARCRRVGGALDPPADHGGAGRAGGGSASGACASGACRWASSTEMASAASTVPASTTWPGVCMTWRTVPGSSFRRVIERRAMTVPIDVVGWRCSRAFATAAVTDSIGSGWFADAAPASCLDAYFHAARAPPVPTTVASSRTDPIRPRRLMSDALLAYPRARFELEPPPPD